MREIHEVSRSAFLPYVFWYYAIARYQTRSKALGAATLLEERTTKFLLGLWRFQHHFIEPALIDGVSRQIAGYRFIDPLLWFERANTTALVKASSKEAHDFFYGPGAAPAKPFWQHTTNLLTDQRGKELLAEWEGEGRLSLDRRGLLPDGFLDRVRREGCEGGSRAPLGLVPIDRSLDYEGVVLNTVDDAKVYIGLVREPLADAAKIASWSAEERAVALHLERVDQGRRTRVTDREPLLHYLDEKLVLQELLNLVGPSITTTSLVRIEIGDALGYLARGRPSDPAAADESLDRAREVMFKYRAVDPQFSQRYRQAVEAEWLTFGLPGDRLAERLAERFGRGLFVFRRYHDRKRFGRLSINVPLKERLGKACRSLYIQAVDDPGLAWVELTARTATGLLGFRVGTRASELELDEAALRDLVAAAHGLSRHVHHHRQDYGQGSTFLYARELSAAIELLAERCDANSGRALRKAAKTDAVKLAARLSADDPVPFVSARLDDVWQMRSGQWQFCAIEHIFGTLASPKHIDATAWCSPLIDLPETARLSGLTDSGLHAGLGEVLLLYAADASAPRLTLREYTRLARLLRAIANELSATLACANAIAHLDEDVLLMSKEFPNHNKVTTPESRS